MVRLNLIVLFMALLAGATVNAQQRTCGVMEVLDRQLQEDPGMLQRMQDIERHTEQFIENGAVRERVLVTIPVVVHVVWNISAQNLSDAEILSQIAVLNEDFRRQNADANETPALFLPVAADCEIQFCMATRDPNGNATNGIVRRQTAVTSFSTNDNVKFYSSGGSDIWNRDKYLNIWVCDLGGGLLGYAQFPGGSANTDGVVCDFAYFGRLNSTYPYNEGRTATHEVGHWLNLRHIWGDATCGNDQVSDTPVHNTSNGGCPTYPHASTCSGRPTEMTMNYMDYTYDGCMNIYTQGQKSRMQALFGSGGARVALLTSDGCQPPNGGGCGTPSGLNATNITQTSATLNWGVVSGATSYNVDFRQTGGNWTTTSGITGNSANATGLTANTGYEFRVQAVCGSNNGTYSSIATFTTLASGGCTDPYETNETSGTAKVIPVNTNLNALISTATDKDWFQFNNTSSQRRIKVDLTTLPADYDVRLYRNTTQVGISQNGGTQNEQIILNTNNVNTYRVQVYGYQGAFNASQCYTLRVSLSGSNWREDGTTDGEVTELEIPVILESDGFILFPNPAQDEVYVDVITQADNEVQVALFDAAGRLSLQRNQAISKGDNRITLNLAGLPDGLYMVQVQNGDQMTVKKLVVQR